MSERTAGRPRPSRPSRPWLVVGLSILLALAPHDAHGQFADPCQVACAVTLGATAFTAATGTVVGLGRASGGLSRVNQGLALWGGSFALVAGGGVALAGNGERQRRAVYGAALGTLAGSVAGLAIASIRSGGDGTRTLVASLVGGALGAVAGGVYGALSHEEGGSTGAVPLFSARLRL